MKRKAFSLVPLENEKRPRGKSGPQVERTVAMKGTVDGVLYAGTGRKSMGCNPVQFNLFKIIQLTSVEEWSKLQTMPPKSKPEERDVELHPVSLQVPRYILDHVDGRADKFERSRAAEIIYMLKDYLDLIENPS